ncbi:MAG: trypsin-like serine protease [Bdellovibrionales bacterium]|nr:trypsin-like serine protease [Bdellovibrionales bacterium]
MDARILFPIRTRGLIFVALTGVLVSCANLVETLKESQRIDDDMIRASQIPYKGPGKASIVGGLVVKDTDPSAKLAVLLLITRGSSLSACTGILVKKNVLLTAAHCVSGVEAKKIRVVFKTLGFPAGTSASDLFGKKIVIHEKFDGKPQNYSDLALLSLTADAPSGYHPIDLYDAKEKMTDDDVVLLGYGITGEEKKDSMTLRQTTKSFKNEIYLKNEFFGIDQKSRSGGFCRGDSGAPVLVNVGKTKKLFGMNSFTVGLEEGKECHTASVAMATSHFHDWIKKNVSEL